MIWKRFFLAWTALLALVFTSAGASANPDVSLKPHVGAFDLVVASAIGVNADASAEEHWGKRRLPTADTSDFPFAARGGGKGLGANPFKGKTFKQIDKMLTKRGFVKMGVDPASGKGSYLHPKSGRQYYLDKGGVYKGGKRELPHVDVHRLDKNSPLPKRKYPLGDRLIE